MSKDLQQELADMTKKYEATELYRVQAYDLYGKTLLEANELRASLADAQKEINGLRGQYCQSRCYYREKSDLLEKHNKMGFRLRRVLCDSRDAAMSRAREAEAKLSEAEARVNELEANAARIDCGCQDKIVALRSSEEYAMRWVNSAELELKKQVNAWFEMKDRAEQAGALNKTLEAQVRGMREIVESAMACFDTKSPGIWYPAFIELLQERVKEFTQSRKALSTPNPSEDKP